MSFTFSFFSLSKVGFFFPHHTRTLAANTLPGASARHLFPTHAHLAANTLPEAFTRQMPTLRRYSSRCRTAATVEEANDAADEEEGTAAAAEWDDGDEPVLLRGVGNAPVEAATKKAERMGKKRERKRARRGKRKPRKMVLSRRKTVESTPSWSRRPRFSDFFSSSFSEEEKTGSFFRNNKGTRDNCKMMERARSESPLRTEVDTRETFKASERIGKCWWV